MPLRRRPRHRRAFCAPVWRRCWRVPVAKQYRNASHPHPPPPPLVCPTERKFEI